jgi:hypothetical protein
VDHGWWRRLAGCSRRWRWIRGDGRRRGEKEDRSATELFGRLRRSVLDFLPSASINEYKAVGIQMSVVHDRPPLLRFVSIPTLCCLIIASSTDSTKTIAALPLIAAATHTRDVLPGRSLSLRYHPRPTRLTRYAALLSLQGCPHLSRDSSRPLAPPLRRLPVHHDVRHRTVRREGQVPVVGRDAVDSGCVRSVVRDAIRSISQLDAGLRERS